MSSMRFKAGVNWLAYSDYLRALAIVNDLKMRNKHHNDKEVEALIKKFKELGELLIPVVKKERIIPTFSM